MEEKIRNKVEKFLKIIEDIFGKRLLSCILYGSAVKGNYKEGISDINLIIIIDKFEAKDLDEIKRRVSKFAWKNLIKPYFFSEWFLLSSADVFPVEWMDIKENHIVLYGEDLTEKINVENKNLRIELERKLKQLFLDFQQGIIFEKNKHIVLEETIKSLNFLIPVIEKQIVKRIDIPRYSRKENIEEKVDEILKFFNETIIFIEKKF
ncbi:MAG: hypothetical protein ACP5H7_02900 [Minisyncoccia bacterium]